MTEAADADRLPTITRSGRATLARMVEHSAAPRFRNRSGNRLTLADLAAVARYDHKTLGARLPDPVRGMPGWVAPFLRQAFAAVPHYRALRGAPESLADIPTVCRADLAANIAMFVPDDTPVGRLISYQTTGTTGKPLIVPSHPQVAALTLVFHSARWRASASCRATEPADGWNATSILESISGDCLRSSTMKPSNSSSCLTGSRNHASATYKHPP